MERVFGSGTGKRGGGGAMCNRLRMGNVGTMVGVSHQGSVILNKLQG